MCSKKRPKTLSSGAKVLDQEVVLQPRIDSGYRGLTSHVLDRLSPYAIFASKRMNDRTANAYLFYMNHILEDLIEQHSCSTVTNTFEMIMRIEAASTRLPKLEYGVRDTFSGRMYADINARRLALEHTFDLAISYRRFEGCVPFSHDEETLKRFRNRVITSHLKSLSDNI